MASTTCGRCGRLAHMPAATGLQVIPAEHEPSVNYVEAAFKCPNCSRLNIAFDQAGHVDPRLSTRVDLLAAADNWDWRAPRWTPVFGETKVFPDVPEHIAAAATEATLCFSVGAYRAVGALARAVVEATAKDKGFTSGNLWEKIEQLQAADHITKHVKEQAHEIRHLGNDMAHGDFADSVTEEDAEDVLVLMEELLNYAYQSPARLAQRQRRRESRKNAE